MPLIINGTPVDKISGPISMYILTPKKNGLSKNLPVYMLFGDHHTSNENTCDFKSPNTYNIHDINFLSLLNTLATPKEPIDFYIEGGELHKFKLKSPYSKKNPMPMLWNLYTECYNNKRVLEPLAKYEHKTACNKINNIRWHSGDLRYFSNKKLLMKCNMEKFLDSLQFEKGLDRYKFIEAVSNFKKLHGDSCIEKLANSTVSFKDLYNQIFSEDSLILKQLSKFPKYQKDIIIDYIKRYYSYMENKYSSYGFADKKVLEKIHNELITPINKLKNNMDSLNSNKTFLNYLDQNPYYLNKYHEFVVRKNNIIADLYTLCRSLKYLNSEEAVPILNIIYFGNTHINNMVHFLENITELYDKIEVTSVSDYKNINKCIDIKNHIDLDKILRKLRRRRNRELISPELVQPFDPVKRPPSPKAQPVKRPPSPKAQPVKRPPSPKARSVKKKIDTCTCIVKSTKKSCENKPKPGSDFCGVHKNCKEIYQVQPAVKPRKELNKYPVSLKFYTAPRPSEEKVSLLDFGPDKLQVFEKAIRKDFVTHISDGPKLKYTITITDIIFKPDKIIVDGLLSHPPDGEFKQWINIISDTQLSDEVVYKGVEYILHKIKVKDTTKQSVKNPPSPKTQPKKKTDTCRCIVKSTKKPCENKAKPGSDFCGVHKNCKI